MIKANNEKLQSQVSTGSIIFSFFFFFSFFQTFTTRCCILKWLFKLNFFPSISILHSAFSEFFFNYDVISYTKNGLENKASHRGDRMIVSFRCCRLHRLMKTRNLGWSLSCRDRFCSSFNELLKVINLELLKSCLI